MKKFSTHDLSWAHMSSNKHSCVPMSTQEHSWVWWQGAMSTHECWWALIALWWCHTHDCTCGPMSAHCSMAPSSWVFMAAHECSMVIRNTHGCSWLLMSAHECWWVLMRAHDCSWALMSSHEFSWTWRQGAMSTKGELKSCHEPTAMRPLALTSTNEPSWSHGPILMSTHECPWALMRTHRPKRGLMRAH